MGREIKRTYRFRVYPNKEQRRELAQTFGCCRWVYNWALEKKKTACCREKEVLSYTDLSSHLPVKLGNHRDKDALLNRREVVSLV